MSKKTDKPICMMKKLLILIVALCATFALSAQTYKVGDLYDVNGKKGVVFEVSEDGQHGKIIAADIVSEKMTWGKAMEWAKQLKDGWYIPSIEEMNILLSVREEILAKTVQSTKAYSGYYWTSTEFNADCAWMVSIKTNSRGGCYKANLFTVRPISKF